MIQEKWCVSFSSNGYFSSNVSVQGPFDSEEEAKKFIELWEEERERVVEEALAKDPDADLGSGAELKAHKLVLSISNQNLLDRVRENMKG
jgi:hypothetical protein